MTKIITVLRKIVIVANIVELVMLAVVFIIVTEIAVPYTSEPGLTVATLLLAVIAFLTFASSPALVNAVSETGRTAIQPFILVRGSHRIDRERAARSGKLTNDHVNLPGIELQNIGSGPAIRGKIFLLEGDKEIPLIEEDDRYTFDMISPGEVHLYPSQRYPKLADHLSKAQTGNGETGNPVQRIRLRIIYYDIQDRKYQLDRGEQEINLVESSSAFQGSTTQDETTGWLIEFVETMPAELKDKLRAMICESTGRSTESPKGKHVSL